MTTVSDIFAQADAAGVRLWHADDGRLRFDAPGGLPAPLAGALRAHRDAVLACLPRGYGWARGAVFVRPIDLRGLCLSRAYRLGWPRLRVELPDDAVTVVEGTEAAWRVLTGRGTRDAVACAYLALDDVAAKGRAVA